jgi:hypothetical protein
MRTLVIAMIALGAFALRAAAQTATPAVGSEQIYFNHLHRRRYG